MQSLKLNLLGPYIQPVFNKSNRHVGALVTKSRVDTKESLPRLTVA